MKLTWLPMVAAAVLLALPESQAMAASMPGDRVGGVIAFIDVDTGTFTVAVPRGEVAVQTLPTTQFIRKWPGGGMELISFDDLVVGEPVKAIGTWQGELFYATRVVVGREMCLSSAGCT